MEEISLSEDIYVSDMMDVLIPFLKERSVGVIKIEYYDLGVHDDYILKNVNIDELEMYVNTYLNGDDNVLDFTLTFEDLEIRFDGNKLHVKGKLAQELVTQFN